MQFEPILSDAGKTYTSIPALLFRLDQGRDILVEPKIFISTLNATVFLSSFSISEYVVAGLFFSKISLHFDCSDSRGCLVKYQEQ